MTEEHADNKPVDNNPVNSQHADSQPADSQLVDNQRRRLLTAATTGMGLAGAAGMLVPFAGSMVPSEKAKAAGAPVEVDISNLEPGQQLTVEWRGKPVWIIARSQEALDFLSSMDDSLADPASESDQQPDYARNEHRSIKQKVLVLVGICTHLGCAPKYRPELAADESGAFLCACHGSRFDLAGRVYRNVPAPTNLEVPPHKYLSDSVILIGEDQGTA